MTDDGDKQKFDEQLSLLDARARKRRRFSLLLTAVLVGVTASLVLQLARDIVDKQAQVHRAEQSRGELDERLRTEEQKLDKATRAREKLEAEIRQLEATKKTYQDRILGEKEAHNLGSSQGVTNGKSPNDSVPIEARIPAGLQGTQAPVAAAQEHQALLIEESGKAPEGFSIKPSVKVTPGVGVSGRNIFKVQLWLDVPEAKRADVERVTYHLSPKYYLRNEIEGGAQPTFEAQFNVFACESTVLARVRLRDGTALAVDFDWCRHESWPARKKEPVIVTSEGQKTPTLPPLTTVPSSVPRPVPFPTPR